MIRLTDLGGQTLWLNPDLIERLQSTPDTVIMMLTGSNMMVRETPEEITLLIIDFRRLCNAAVLKKE
jgi:flagellar protein FlbD